MEVHGIRWCTLQGLEIIQVEILSNKLLTTALEPHKVSGANKKLINLMK